MNKPNFFIVGTPKAGTTSLYYYLEEHPEVYMSPIKETNYFSYDEIKKQGLYYNEEHIITHEDYAAQFIGVSNEKAIGEASVSYLFYPDVPRKLKEFNYSARIIMILRNPVDRGYSHYLMDKRLGFVKATLQDIVHKNNMANQLYYQQYIGLGFYHEQVKRYLDAFGKDQVKIFLYEDIVTDINKVVTEVYDFLGVDNMFIASTGQKYNVALAPKSPVIEKLYSSKAFRSFTKFIFGEKFGGNIKSIFFEKEKKVKLDPSLRADMLEMFKSDILKTSKLINRDLSHWLQ